MSDTNNQVKSIKIGPEFFAGAFRDYADRYWAFVREVMQNSIDADSDRIVVTVSEQNGDTLVVIEDDGIGMDRSVLEDKFLALGESGKRFVNGKVGGFGKAKELIAFCHKHYTIDTQRWTVDGSGATYTINERPYRTGCRFSILWTGNCVEELNNAFRRFAAYAQWSGTLIVNNTVRPTNLRKGSPRREFSFGSIYSNRTFDGVAVIRIHGIPMFVRHITFKGTIVVELSGEGDKVLTANRDGLQYTYSEQLQNFLTELVINKRSALQNKEARYHRYEGPSIHVASVREQSTALTAILAAASTQVSSDESFETPQQAPDQSYIYTNVGSTVTVAERRNSNDLGVKIRIGHQFIVKNTTGMETPTFYRPESDMFGNYCLTLTKFWSRILVEMHKLFNAEGNFSVGFVLDEENEAEHETSSAYGTVYYINPATVVTQTGASKGRSFKKRFKLTERYRILAIAAHEFVHGLGYRNHDEDYASKLTDVMGVVMTNMKRFTPCFMA